MNSREDWYSANKARIFPDFGSLESAEMSIDGLSPRKGESYTDMRLVNVQSSTQQEKYIVTLVYETLGDSFVQVKDDSISYEGSGLRKVVRKSIAKAATDFQKTVGTTSINSHIDNETVTCFLSSYEIDDTDSYREVTEVYVEPGEIETSTKPGRISGTTEITITSTGTAIVPSGTLISSSQTEKQGYSTFTRTSVQGTIQGTKQTYTDVIDVEVPGEVLCTTEGVSQGPVSGSIALPKVTPRRSKKVAATVTVEVTDTPPSTTQLAFDLGSISCSVTSISKNLRTKTGPTQYTAVGTRIRVTTAHTDVSRTFNASARIQVYPGSFLTGSGSSSGSIGYTSSVSNQVNSDGTGLSGQSVGDASVITQCIGNGSTSAAGYSETGILKRSSRPVLTDLAGNTFYEVITWSI